MSRVWVVLDAQGWTDLMVDHHPTEEEIVREFYANLHQKAWQILLNLCQEDRDRCDSHPHEQHHRSPTGTQPGLPMAKGSSSHSCQDSGVLHRGAPSPNGDWGEGSFQLSDLCNDFRCIYHVLTSQILPILSHTMITMERARCLYGLLTEASIDYGILVTATMMTVRHPDKSIALPYGVLITQIVEHARVSTEGMREVHPKKGPIDARFLNTSNAHL